MLFLALAVACSTAIAVLFKLTEGRMDRVALLTVNYLVAFAVAGGRVAAEGWEGGGAAALYGLGTAVGVLFIGGFFLFSLAIGVAGLSLATGTMRLSVAIPFAASWLIWGEVPSPAQLLGLVAAGAAFMLIARRPAVETVADVAPVEDLQPAADGQEGAARTALVLTALFLAGGIVDTAMKVFEEELAATQSRPLFLLLVFGVAFGVGAAIVGAKVLRTGRWPKRAVWGWGVVLGAVNYGSAEFILLALSSLPGTFVFPATNVAVVGLPTLLGVVVWGERPTVANRVGLVLAAVALVLLAL